VPPPTTWRHDLPQAVNPLLLPAVAKDPEMRYQSAAAFDNAFRIRAINLSPNSLFTAAAAPLVKDSPVAVASPDVGGIKRAQLWREALEREWNRPVGQASSTSVARQAWSAAALSRARFAMPPC
jgi:hypothetical protein